MRRALIILFAVLGLTTLGVGAAMANTYYFQQGNDLGSVQHGYVAQAGTVQYHKLVTVGDHECDGHTVFMSYEVSKIEDNGSLTPVDNWYHVYDTDGCDGDSYRVSWVGRPYAVRVAHLCEEVPTAPGGVVCSDAKYIDNHIGA